jgi:hypothetical protein
MKYADAHLERWCSERRVSPWPVHDGGSPSATELFESYSATLAAEGQRRTDLTTFGKGLVELGFKSERLPEGIVYHDLSLLTRRERAEAAVWLTDPRPRAAFETLASAERAAHMERVDHGVEVTGEEVPNPNKYDTENPVIKNVIRTPLPCKHSLPPHVIEAARAAAEGVREQLRASGWLDREVERRFGYYLSGHPFPAQARAADEAVERLDVLIPELDRMWAERKLPKHRERKRKAVEARQAYLAMFPLPPFRQGDPTHIESVRLREEAERLAEEAAAHDAEYDRLYNEAKAAQDTLRKAMAVLARYDAVTGTVRDPEPVTEPASSEW